MFRKHGNDLHDKQRVKGRRKAIQYVIDHLKNGAGDDLIKEPDIAILFYLASLQESAVNILYFQ